MTSLKAKATHANQQKSDWMSKKKKSKKKDKQRKKRKKKETFVGHLY
jgi:hypothetical protein